MKKYEWDYNGKGDIAIPNDDEWLRSAWNVTILGLINEIFIKNGNNLEDIKHIFVSESLKEFIESIVIYNFNSNNMIFPSNIKIFYYKNISFNIYVTDNSINSFNDIKLDEVDYISVNNFLNKNRKND